MQRTRISEIALDGLSSNDAGGLLTPDCRTFRTTNDVRQRRRPVTLFAMKRQGQEEWLRDVAARQRNVVFPDTAANEARFWRNIISGKRRLTPVQIIGITAVCLALAFPLWDIAKSTRTSNISWLILGVFAASFALLRWRTRRALSGIEGHSKRGKRAHGRR